MTSWSAKSVTLKGRGVIREEGVAEIVLFEPDTIIDAATFDSPERPATGIDTVLVNGVIAWRQGAGTGERNGRLLTNPVV